MLEEKNAQIMYMICPILKSIFKNMVLKIALLMKGGLRVFFEGFGELV